MSPHRPSSRGFTLIEVLVTVFVIAVGLLAMAGLQIMAKKSAFDAAQRTVAGHAAQDILTRMRANPQMAAQYVTANAVALSAPGADCLLTDCTPAELAAWDLFRWGQHLAAGGETDDLGEASGGLVNPTACVIAGTTPGHFRIAVAWRGITPLAAPADENDPTDPANVDCGRDAYLDAAGVDDFRRVMVMDAFVADPT